MLLSDGALEPPPKVLDLYAGTGALAFEALSRGAREACVVEHAKEALAVIRENSAALDAQLLVIATRVERAVATLASDFDLVFADPPYADVRTPPFRLLLAILSTKLAIGARLVLEHASADEAPTIEGLFLYRSRLYGDTALSFYRRD